MGKDTGLAIGIPTIETYRKEVTRCRQTSRMNVSKDWIGGKLRGLTAHYPFVSYSAPQGDFQYYSVGASVRSGIGWKAGSNTGRTYCFLFEKRFPDCGLVQGYYASRSWPLIEAELQRLAGDGWKVLRKSWENNDKS